MSSPLDEKPVRTLRIEDWIDQDLTAAAKAGRLAPAFDRDEAVRSLAEALNASPARSPILTGPPGIGKTAVLYELLRRAHAGDGPAILRENRVVQLSFRNIASHFGNKSKAMSFARKLFDVLRAEPVIVFVRDIHLAFDLDWEPILYRYLCRAGRPLIGEGYTRGVESLIEHSSDLAEFLVHVPLSEPKVEDVRSLVRQWSTWQVERSGRPIATDAQRIGIELTGRFLGDRPYPRKVLDLLAETRDVTAARPDDGDAVTMLDVVERFSATSRVPAPLVNPRVPLDLEVLRSFLAARLLGQEEAVEAMMKMVALIKSGLSDLSRPFGVFLFVGPTGVGKTHTAQLLAEYLFGDGQRMIRINLTDFSDDSAPLQLFGNPGGYRLVERVGVLAARLRGQPFGVLLLDEFEKANPKVYDAFMQLFDEGRFINGNGDTVSVTSLIVIATSNAGAEVYRETGLGFRKELDVASLDAELDRRLHKIFRFELLNRFDRVVHFHPLDRTHIRSIAARELGRLLVRDGIQSRNLSVEVDPEVVEWLAAYGYHPHYGARFLRREIERHVTAALADLIVRNHPANGARLQLGVRGDRVHARVLSEPVERTPVHLPDGPATRPAQLDQEAVLAAAHDWVVRWEPLLVESGARRDAASLLITESNAPGFWNDPERAREVLRRYRSLEARLQADERLAAPARRLQRALEESRLPPLDELGRLVQDAAWNYRKWLDLGAKDGPDGAWIVLSPGDPISPAPGMVADLAAMYLAWLERRGLSGEVVAEEEVNGEIVRAIVEAEGPGVLALLEMEHGRHRRRKGDADVERVNVEILPRHPTVRRDHRVNVEAAKNTKGKLVPKRTARLRLEVPGRGMNVLLVGSERETLLHLGGDLSAAWAAPPPELELARTYGITGGTARDPRTDAVVANVKEALRGNLDPFWKAWEQR